VITEAMMTNGWEEVTARAVGDPDLAALLDAIVALAQHHPGAHLLVTPLLTANRRLVRLPAVQMTGEWSPTLVPALMVCDGWPQTRPQLLLHDSLRRKGASPPAFSAQYVEGDAWFSYSFAAPYDPSHPALVPVVRGWLQRFDGRP
jgi:hypothetical protein